MDSSRLDRLRDRLREANLEIVSERCLEIRPSARGVSRTNLIAIRDGRTDNPGIMTVDLIEAALDSIETSTPQEVAS